MSELTLVNSNLSTSDILSLINPNLKENTLVEGYNNLILNYKSLSSKQAKKIRKSFQSKFNIEYSNLLTKDNTIETNKALTSEFKDSILKINNDLGVFLVRNASKNAVFCVVNVSKLFSKVETVKENISEVKESEVDKEVKKEVEKFLQGEITSEEMNERADKKREEADRKKSKK